MEFLKNYELWWHSWSLSIVLEVELSPKEEHGALQSVLSQLCGLLEPSMLSLSVRRRLCIRLQVSVPFILELSSVLFCPKDFDYGQSQGKQGTLDFMYCWGNEPRAWNRTAFWDWHFCVLYREQGWQATKGQSGGRGGIVPLHPGDSS